MTDSVSLVAQSYRLDLSGGRQRSVIRVEVCRPNSEVLVIVFDLSDSCKAMDHELAMLVRLLAKSPRDMPLWFYCISRPMALDEQPYRIAHFVDGSINLRTWLDNNALRQAMALRGSLLRPVIDNVQSRLHREAIVQATLLVLTDGDLLDISPLTVPENINILGVTASDTSSTRWHLVLPSAPLAAISDRSLDRAFLFDRFPFYGECEACLEGTSGDALASLVDLDNKRLEIINAGTVTWNLADKPLLIAVDSSANPALLPILQIRSLRTGQHCKFPLASLSSCGMSGDISAALDLMGQSTAILEETIIDVKIGDPGFTESVAQFANAQRLCENKMPWVDATGSLVVWKEYTTCQEEQMRANCEWDSLICVAVDNGDASPERLILVGLQRHRRPAFAWRSLNLPALDPSLNNIEVFFDRREDRWYISRGESCIEELEPSGSQLIYQGSHQTQSCKYVVLFSGNL